MTCRDEILKCFAELERQTGRKDFAAREIADLMALHGTRYMHSTIVNHIRSRMCENAPDHHGTTYPDLVRVGRGRYRCA